MNLADAIRRAAQSSGAVLGKPETNSNMGFEPVQQAVTAEEIDLATTPAQQPVNSPDVAGAARPNSAGPTKETWGEPPQPQSPSRSTEPLDAPAHKLAKEPTLSHSKHRNLSVDEAPAGHDLEEHAAHPHNVVRLELVLNPEQLKGFFGAVTASQHSVLTIREAASFLRVTPKALQRLAEEGEVPGLLVDGKWRFTRQGLDDWFNAHPKRKEA